MMRIVRYKSVVKTKIEDMRYAFIYTVHTGRNVQGAAALTFARATPNARPPMPPPQMSTLSLTSKSIVSAIFPLILSISDRKLS